MNRLYVAAVAMVGAVVLPTLLAGSGTRGRAGSHPYVSSACAAEPRCADWWNHVGSHGVKMSVATSAISQVASERAKDLSTPMVVRDSWKALKAKANFAYEHGRVCTKYYCAGYATHVDACYEAVVVAPPAAGESAPACSELNHVDPAEDR